MRAFISVDGFEVNRVTHDVIFTGDTIATVHIARLAGDVEGFANIIAFHDLHHFRGKPALIH